MWISKEEYQRLVKRIEVLERGPIHRIYESGYPLELPLSEVINAIASHLDIALTYSWPISGKVQIAKVGKQEGRQD